jgi:hypothetical protein
MSWPGVIPVPLERVRIDPRKIGPASSRRNVMPGVERLHGLVNKTLRCAALEESVSAQPRALKPEARVTLSRRRGRVEDHGSGGSIRLYPRLSLPGDGGCAGRSATSLWRSESTI